MIRKVFAGKVLGPLAALLLGTASFGAMSNENADENANQQRGNSLSALYEMLSPGGTKKPPP